MQIKKNCIFLSASNIELMTKLRSYSLKQGIDLYPCRQVVEMLNLYNKGTNAVLVEKIEKFNNLNKYLSKQNIKDFYYLQYVNNKIKGLNK